MITKQFEDTKKQLEEIRKKIRNIEERAEKQELYEHEDDQRRIASDGTAAAAATTTSTTNTAAAAAAKDGEIEEIKKELEEFNSPVKYISNHLQFIEFKIKESLRKKNDKVAKDRKKYELANENYTENNNISSATSILKIDSYDRNIEENFYIMYYLLSYGVLGFFIYKLLKM